MSDAPGSASPAGAEGFFDEAPCGFLIVAPGWTVQNANRTFLSWTGKAASEVEGRNLRELLDVAGRIFFDTHFAPLVRLQGAFHEVALNIRRADGTKMPALVNAAERLGPDGELEAMLVTVLNATDRRRYEEELLRTRNDLRELNEELEARVAAEVERRMAAEAVLARAQKMEAIGALSAGIAHDFNNTLQIVSANLGLLTRRVDAQSAEFVSNALSGVDRGAKLARKLLSFGRSAPVEAVTLDAAATVEGLGDMISRVMSGEAEVQIDVPDDPLPVEVDLSELENALLNLSINARDAMAGAADPRLRIAARALDEGADDLPEGAEGAHVEIRVEDNGCGMDEATLGRLFEPFFTTKPEGKGTGLGLSMVYAFARQSGGRVTALSAPGRGTAISIWLPRAPGPIRRKEDLDAGDVPGGSESVLLVEDSDAVRRGTRALLEELGYSVLTARDGAEARERLASSGGVDLVILDLVLRGSEDGATLLRQLVEAGHEGGALLTSARADEFDGRLDRSVELLRKPYGKTALAGAVRRALGAARRGAGPDASGSLRVLLVEDEALIRLAAVAQLSDLGHAVVEASSAEEALGHLESGPVDVLMTDLGLPGMDGGTLAARARDIHPGIGVVFVTGAEGLPPLSGAVRLGKPYSDEQIARALREARGE